MPAIQAPNANLNYGWDGEEQGLPLQLDENWRAIDALLGSTFIINEVNAVPASPVNGNKYLIIGTATGDFEGHEGKVARYINDGEWELYELGKGWQLLNLSTGQRYYNDGSVWKPLHSLLGKFSGDTEAAAGGVPIDGEYIKTPNGQIHIRLA